MQAILNWIWPPRTNLNLCKTAKSLNFVIWFLSCEDYLCNAWARSDLILVHLSETLYDGNSKGQCEVFWESESTSMPCSLLYYVQGILYCERLTSLTRRNLGFSSFIRKNSLNKQCIKLKRFKESIKESRRCLGKPMHPH